MKFNFIRKILYYFLRPIAHNVLFPHQGRKQYGKKIEDSHYPALFMSFVVNLFGYTGAFSLIMVIAG
jgi:hypothetical protein